MSDPELKQDENNKAQPRLSLETYLPNVYRFGSTDDDGLSDVHYIVCRNAEQATGFANALFDGSPEQGSVTAPELVADYCFIHRAYVNELAAVERERIEELTAENVRLREALRSIAQEEDMLGFMYAARIAKTALEEKEENNDG